MYKSETEFNVLSALKDIQKTIVDRFAGFVSVSEADGRRIAYAAQNIPKTKMPSYLIETVPTSFERTGPAALVVPAYAWVRTHDGVSTLCATHKNGVALFQYTPLYELARQYVHFIC